MANSEVDTTAASLQHAEIIAAHAEINDFDYAYSLQLQEALAASQQLPPPPNFRSVQPPPPHNFHAVQPLPNLPAAESGDMKLLLEMQATELRKYQQEVADREQACAEMRLFSEKILQQNHDTKFARDLNEMADSDWEVIGDEYEKPFDYSTCAANEQRPFKLYFKGHISCEYVGVPGVEDSWDSFAGAGIAIYDPDDKLVVEVRKPLGKDLCRTQAEYFALKEGLATAVSSGIRNIHAFGDSLLVHNQLTGNWTVRQRKILNYVHEVEDQIHKLDKVFMVLLPRCDNKHALTLAREAIDSQLIRRAEYYQQEKSNKENCNICLEDYEASQMYVVMNCHHRYCVSCMAQHAEVKLQYGCLPACPYEGCNAKLTVECCKNFLSSKLIEIFAKRLEEAAIPDSDKVYCPYSDCSALMRKVVRDTLPSASSSSHPSMRAECLKCYRFFCIECRVPWHANMSCQDYERHAPQLYGTDAKLHLLAKDNRWRRCTKCKHMIELAEGCNHMTCRCGFEFCYVCGAEWKNKKQTCECLLWEERNIIQEPLADDDDSGEEYGSDDEHYVGYPPFYPPHHRRY